MNSFKAIVGKFQFFSREDEYQLMLRWQVDRDERARELLFASVFPLMLKIVAKFCKQYGRRDIEEFESVAADGVLSAIDKFDSSLGFRLTTYATRSAWTHMQKQLSRRVIQLPVAYYRQSIYVDDVERSLRMAPLPDPNSDFFTDTALIVRNRDDECEAADEQAALCGALEQLGQRERVVIRGCFFEQRTLRDIGVELGVTRERIRQIRDQAIRRLRQILEPAAA